jgi:hypothetical protein
MGLPHCGRHGRPWIQPVRELLPAESLQKQAAFSGSPTDGWAQPP